MSEQLTTPSDDVRGPARNSTVNKRISCIASYEQFGKVFSSTEALASLINPVVWHIVRKWLCDPGFIQRPLGFGFAPRRERNVLSVQSDST
jgi:hypothetical protein